MPLQENLGGEGGKLVLTGEADGAGEEDSTNRNSLQGFGETSLVWF
jgi:hypothetical protein